MQNLGVFTSQNVKLFVVCDQFFFTFLLDDCKAQVHRAGTVNVGFRHELWIAFD